MRVVLDIRSLDYEPSKWERLLHELHVNEANVLGEVKASTSAGKAISAFIYRYQHGLYVPEAILLAMGIPTWQ